MSFSWQARVQAFVPGAYLTPTDAAPTTELSSTPTQLTPSKTSPSPLPSLSPLKAAPSIHKRLQFLLLVLRQTDGRDKILKGDFSNSFSLLISILPLFLLILHRLNFHPLNVVIQYACKLLLLYPLARPSVQLRWPSLKDRLSRLAAALSIARKLIRLGHGLEPYTELHPSLVSISKLSLDRLSMTPTQTVFECVNNVLSLLNDVSDDVVCLSKVGLLDAARGKTFEPISNWLWLSCIALDIYAGVQALFGTVAKLQLAQRQLAPSSKGSFIQSAPLVSPNLATPTARSGIKDGLVRQLAECKVVQDKLWLQQASFYKLLADLGFCAYDVLEAQHAPRFQTWCGFMAACLGFYKLWFKAVG